MTTKTRLTYSEYRKLPDTDPYEHEMIAGEEFVSPSPSVWHEFLMMRFAELLHRFLGGKGLGRVVGPVDLYYSEREYVSPDVCFVTEEQFGQLKDAQEVRIPPPLVVEILSKSSVKWDREDKRGFYKRFGVQEYWIIDPFEQTIEVIDLAADVVSRDDPASSKMLPGFSMRWQELFAPED
ncbi:MAG TPA: Uma2 family endonuclease [Chloroflexota bacterium]